MKKYLVFGVILLIVVVGFSYFLLSKRKSSNPFIDMNFPTKVKNENGQNFSFQNPKKSAHYESNTPLHGSVLAGVPINVVIDFNFDLAKPSEIKIIKEGQDFGEGETRIDANKLSMRRNMKESASDGLYEVKYKACWPDGSCHDGNFQFAIDKSKTKGFEDLTGRKEVTIRLSQIKFSPQNVKVSKGTKVIWINDEATGHYINTDSHPAHTYFPSQNSNLLEKGGRFSLVFDKVGIYPYHCSAHASSMIGSLLVE